MEFSWRSKWMATWFVCMAAIPSLAQSDGVEPLARGPIHEAFANPIDGTPKPGPIIDREPPAPIEEIPPEQKPDDDDVQWIPGYWAWDDGRDDFLWVSGFWRTPPPGRIWIPGNWERMADGWRWVPGFWASAETPALNYLPPPPDSIESGPSTPAPSNEHIYVPGTWVYSSSRYVWRPGTWVVYRPGWVWIPACYRWTPAGYVFIEGYWDYPLARRGLLFAPVWIDRRICYRPRWFYSPTIAIYDDALYGALFVRPGCSHYFFGDYFEARFTRIGYRSWFSVSFGRGFTYDPLWSYYEIHYRRDPFWAPAIREVYMARYAGHLPRPPVTVINQVNNITVNNVTKVNNINIINNPTIVNNYKNLTKSTQIANITNVNNTVVNVRNIDKSKLPSQVVDANTLEKFQKLKPVSGEQREVLVRESRQMRDLAKHRAELEKQLRSQEPENKITTPRAVNLEVPPSLVSPAINKPKVAPPPPAVEKPKRPDVPAVTPNKPKTEPKQLPIRKPETSPENKSATGGGLPDGAKKASPELPKPPTIEKPKPPSLPTLPKQGGGEANVPPMEKLKGPEGSKNPSVKEPNVPPVERPTVPSLPKLPKQAGDEANVPPMEKPKGPEGRKNPSVKEPNVPPVERPKSPILPNRLGAEGNLPMNNRGSTQPNQPNLERSKTPAVPATPNRPGGDLTIPKAGNAPSAGSPRITRQEPSVKPQSPNVPERPQLHTPISPSAPLVKAPGRGPGSVGAKKGLDNAKKQPKAPDGP